MIVKTDCETDGSFYSTTYYTAVVAAGDVPAGPGPERGGGGGRGAAGRHRGAAQPRGGRRQQERAGDSRPLAR